MMMVMMMMIMVMIRLPIACNDDHDRYDQYHHPIMINITTIDHDPYPGDDDDDGDQAFHHPFDRNDHRDIHQNISFVFLS